jgi:polar amino acid transport system substrate-binding protein
MKKLLLVIISLLFMNTCLAAPLTTEDEVAQGRIGTWPGSLAEDCAKAKFPGAEIVYFETVADMAQNLRQKKIEAFAMNRLFVDELLSSGQTDVEILGEALGKTSFSFVFAESEKGRKLCSEFNEFLKENQENGNLYAWQNKWLSSEAEGRGMEEIPLTGENGRLNVVTNPVFPPLVYMQENKISGYEAELFLRFCAKYGYDYRHTVASFDTAMAGVSTGQFDLGFVRWSTNRSGQSTSCSRREPARQTACWWCALTAIQGWDRWLR